MYAEVEGAKSTVRNEIEAKRTFPSLHLWSVMKKYFNGNDWHEFNLLKHLAIATQVLIKSLFGGHFVFRKQT